MHSFMYTSCQSAGMYVCMYIHTYVHVYIHAHIVCVTKRSAAKDTFLKPWQSCTTYIYTQQHTHIHTYIHAYTGYRSPLQQKAYFRGCSSPPRHDQHIRNAPHSKYTHSDHSCMCFRVRSGRSSWGEASEACRLCVACVYLCERIYQEAAKR